MPQVTKRIQATSTLYDLTKSYAKTPSCTPVTTEAYDTLKLTFDVSNVKNATSATLVYSLSKAKFNKLAWETGNVRCFVEVDSVIYYSKLKDFSTGSESISIAQDKIQKINEKNIITVEIDGYVYDVDNGTATDYTRQIGYLYETLDVENCYLEVEVFEPKVTDFTVSGTSIDAPVTCNWNQEDVSTWTVTVKKNGVVKATKTGTTANSCTFPVGTFNETGTYTFEITAVNGSSATASATATLTGTQASISLLELPSQNINVDEAFTISWVSQNQSRFVLNVGGVQYTGTTQKSVTVPKGAISKGTKQVTLTVYYENAYYSNSATTNDSFVGYGKPSKPVLTTSASYNSARPTLSWTSSEQTAYRVTIKQLLTTIETSGDVTSQLKYYIPSTTLQNNTTYQIEVQVKNKYGLWSDKATASFTVQFNMPPAPAIQAISDVTTGSIILSVSTTITTEYKNTEIWKREKGGSWKRMAYKLKAADVWQDFYVAGSIEYEYKARNIGKNGGVSESAIVTASTECKGYIFYDVEDTTNLLRFETGNYPKPKINQPNIVQNLFANASAPTTHGDGTLYWSCSMTFTTSDQEDIYKLFELLKSKLLLYKDNKGHKWFGNIINSPEFPEDDVEIITLQIEFMQSQFLEEDVYCGDNLELITWNGGWKFDGTHVFGGE